VSSGCRCVKMIRVAGGDGGRASRLQGGDALLPEGQIHLAEDKRDLMKARMEVSR
jgi:hypothetical protein